MSILTVGLNHATAPVQLREQVSIPNERIPVVLSELRAVGGVHESAVLSTCNRTELYCAGDGLDAARVVTRWSEISAIPRDRLQPSLYELWDRDAVQHLLRVASGLDSMVLGEPQILGQIKLAYQNARESGNVGRLLERLFQHTFAVAKQVRTDTGIGVNSLSVAAAAVQLAKRIFADLADHSVLLIGAGDTIETAARHLYDCGARKLTVANRTVARAESLATRFRGKPISLTDIPAHLAGADIIISSTASPLPILGKGAIERALTARKHRPMFIVDLAVPRDVEPEVANLDDVYLYSVDDLQAVVADNLQSRQDAARQADAVIIGHVEAFTEWQRSLEAVSPITELRDRAAEVGAELTEQALRQLAAGGDPAKVVRRLAHRLSNRLLHQPTVALRRAAADGDVEALRAARRVLGLDSKEN
ncbi:MAG: glutamyl-tRNA reductase [Chromatiales bacterium]|nr:glutamyl-tRNA reductase [Chromatiales bacterium]